MEFNRNLGWIRGGSDVDPGWSDTHFRNIQFPTGFIPWYLYFCSAIILLRYTFAPRNFATLFPCNAKTLQQSSTALIARPNYKAAMNVIEKEMMTHRKPYKPLVEWRIPENNNIHGVACLELFATLEFCNAELWLHYIFLQHWNSAPTENTKKQPRCRMIIVQIIDNRVRCFFYSVSWILGGSGVDPGWIHNAGWFHNAIGGTLEFFIFY
jgi:hypothetical protein